MKFSFAFLPVMVMSLTLLAGCASQPGSGQDHLPKGQQYSLDHVQGQLGMLRRGMTSSEVQRILGTPARRDNDRDTWTYLPNRKNTLQLEKKLVIKFFDDVYIDHKYMTTYELDYVYEQKQ